MKKKEKEAENTMFWENKKKRKLTVLNPDDFERPVPGLLNFAGSIFNETSAISDSKELIGRNELVKFFFKRPKLRQKVSEWLKEKNASITLPQNENGFLHYYENEKHPYWDLVKEIIQEFSTQGPLPTKLQPFIKKTKADIAKEGLEKEMAKDISKKIKKVANLEGVVWMTIKPDNVSYDTDNKANIIIGQKAFSSAWTADYVAPIPNWCKKKFWRFLGVRKLMQKKANHNAYVKAKKSAIIQYFPESIFKDIASGVYKMFHLHLFSRRKVSVNSKKDQKIQNFWNKMPYETHCQFHFSYSEFGLSLSLIRVKRSTQHISTFMDSSRIERTYDGFNEKERKAFVWKLNEIDVELNAADAVSETLPIIESFKKLFKVKIGQKNIISAPLTDFNFKWHYISNLYNSEEHIKVYQDLLSQRRYFWEGISELNGLGEIIERFVETAKQKNLPLCAPEINESKIGVNFKNLAPINMIRQEKPMIMFSFPTINGDIICLTGKHGRGKSVSGKSVLESLWLAHTGLLVFAESFSTDIKEMIGAVTNDDGEGSTATVFAQKTKNLFDNISQVPAHKSLLFIDEIGKGTQEESGMILGQQILSALNKNGNSVIFNTQIMRLAEHAQKNLKASCLRVNSDHQFELGIGTGQMAELVKEVGLDKYFKN